MEKVTKSKKSPGPLNKGLQEAVQLLYKQNIIKADKDIAERTGYGKSTISEYIGGNKLASDDFIEKFEKVFELKIKESTAKPQSDHLLPSTKGLTIDDYIKKIEEHNRFLQKIIETGLIDIKQSLEINFASLQESQDSAIIYQKAWIEKVARNEGGADAKMVQAVRDEMDTIIALKRRGDPSENNTDVDS